MIIGFAGKKQHGKDTATKMWDYLRYSEGNCEFADYVEYINNGFTVKNNFKFADKLKDIICLLTGCTREQLESNDFKDSFMPSMWDKEIKELMNYNSLIDRIAQKPGKRYPAAQFAKIDDWESKNTYHEYIYYEKMTYRDALQLVGTNALRKMFHDDVWVNATMVEVMATRGDRYVSDVRFPNEVMAIQNVGGTVIKIIRTDLPSTDTHESETALDNWKFEYTVAVPTGEEGLFNRLKDLYAIL